MAATTLSSHIAHGVKLGQGTYGATLIVTGSGAINAPAYAIYAGTRAGELINYGSIRANVVAVELYGGNLDNKGIIYGASYGVALYSNVTVLNTGTIAAGAEYAVGLVKGGSLDNLGEITSKNLGVVLRTGATLSNTGSIYGKTFGVATASDDVLKNAGTVSGGADYAVGIIGGSRLDNTGHIIGTNSGVVIEDGAVSNSAVIQGSTLGVFVESGTVVNSGTIYGQIVGIDFAGTSSSGAIAPSTLTNAATGTVSSQGIGVSLLGTTNAAVSMANAGNIFGALTGAYLNDASLTNTGKITGNTFGAYLNGGALTNAGTISGTSFAVDGIGAFTLGIDPGAVFEGGIADQSGTGTLALEGAKGTLAGIGVSITGFSNIYFNRYTAANWTLEGDLAGLASGQTISNFSQSALSVGNTIILKGFAAPTLYDNGAPNLPSGDYITLSDGATSHVLTFDGTGPYGSEFAAYTENGNTYIVLTPVGAPADFKTTPGGTSLINGFSSLSVSPGQGNDALGITIGARGTIATTKAPAIVVPWVVTDAEITNFGLIESRTYAAINGKAKSLVNAGTIIGRASADNITNSGLMSGVATAGSTLDNTGTILGSANASTVTNVGIIIGASGSAVLFNSGNIYGSTIGAFLLNNYLEASTAVNYGSIGGGVTGFYAEYGGTIKNAGTIGGGKYAIVSEDKGDGPHPLDLIVEPGAVLSGSVIDFSFKGQLSLAGSTGGSLDMGTSFIGFDAISFASGAKWRLEGAASDLAGGQTISGFGPGDTIVLDGFSAASDRYVAGSGLALVDGTSSVTLDIVGDIADSFSTAKFLVTADSGETTITSVPCYAKGTGIATRHGEIAVELLNIGDEIRTLHGGYKPVKWIGRRTYNGQFIRANKAALPVCIKAGAIADGVPLRDLWVSPGHAISIDNVLVHASRLLNGVSILQAEMVDTITYYHIELESHEIIFAESCPAESFLDEHFRQQFQNNEEYGRLYPGQLAPAISCQPRLDSGFHLHAIQRRVAARAGLEAPAITGPLRGYVDQTGPIRCFGWAQDIAAPEAPVCLDVLANGRRLGRTLANLYRADVAAAGYGNGYQGFEFILPAGIPGEITVRRSADAAELQYAGPIQLSRLQALA